MRAINRFAHEGPAELGKVEALLAQVDRLPAKKIGKQFGNAALVGFKRTLAGALVSIGRGRIRIEPAPPRRQRR
jgi:tRNA(Ile)-lysidine synthase